MKRYQIACGNQGAARSWLQWGPSGYPTDADGNYVAALLARPLPCDLCGTDMSNAAIEKRVALALENASHKEHPQATRWHHRQQDRWEADHRVPIAEGGEMVPENLRVLCRACHLSETKALRARLAERRRASKEPAT